VNSGAILLPAGGQGGFKSWTVLDQTIVEAADTKDERGIFGLGDITTHQGRPPSLGIL